MRGRHGTDGQESVWRGRPVKARTDVVGRGRNRCGVAGIIEKQRYGGQYGNEKETCKN